MPALFSELLDSRVVDAVVLEVAKPQGFLPGLTWIPESLRQPLSLLERGDLRNLRKTNPAPKTLQIVAPANTGFTPSWAAVAGIGQLPRLRYANVRLGRLVFDAREGVV